MNDIKKNDYAGQIAALVQDFVQVWTKFEAMLHSELARSQHHPQGMQPKGESPPITNYELFYRASSYIYGKNNPTMGELSNALSVPLSKATRIVDWLVANGYAKRLPDPDDRRVVRVALTNNGQELHKILETYTGEHVRQILSCLSDEEQTTLFALIHKVVAALKEVAQ